MDSRQSDSTKVANADGHGWRCAVINAYLSHRGMASADSAHYVEPGG